LSRLLPGGGATGSVFAARDLVAAGNPLPTTILSMAVSWWISMTVLAALVVACTAPGAIAGTIPRSHMVVSGFLLTAFVVGGAVAARLLRSARVRGRLERLAMGMAARLGTTGSRWWTIGEAAHHLGRRQLFGVAGWALAAWVCDVAALGVSFVALGHLLDIGVLLVGYGLVNLLSALPELTPGWLGVLEVTLAVTYAAFGVPVGVAAAAVVGYRLVSYWLPVVAGVPFALRTFRAFGSSVERRSSQPCPTTLSAVA
jgi:hypothetical protein